VPNGRRIAIVGDSGGQSAIAADVASQLGLTVAPFPDSLTESLAGVLPAGAACANPVDLAGAGEKDMHSYARVVEQVSAAPGVDAVVMTGYFGCYGQDIPALAAGEVAVAQRLGALVDATGIPVVVHTMGPESPTAQALWEYGVPAFGSIEAAAGALAHAAELCARPPVETVGTAVPEDTVLPGYWAARELLSHMGVAFPAGAVVHTGAELAALTELRAPYVLKAGWLEHKSEVGGVRIGLADTAELAAAFEQMHDRLGDGDYVVEQQDVREGAVEVLVSARRDPQLGAFVVVGAGGTETEVHQDVRVERAPVSRAAARQMLGALRMAPLLRGWRGRPAVDIDGLADLVVAVSELIAHRADIAELELNPVRATPHGAVAVDALVIPVTAHGHCLSTELGDNT
jgi:acyl-CoA synthetase (NDP forming)